MYQKNRRLSQGKFVIFNEIDEKATLVRFFDHILDIKPLIIVTYNGDSFDWYTLCFTDRK